MCALVGKARNLVVTITLRSNGRSFAARIIDFDEHFLEVLVRVEKNGEYSRLPEDFQNDEKKQDRILVAISDISTIS